jgi:hypothetical protein
MGETCARVRESRNADLEGRITVRLITREVVCERELKPRGEGSNRGLEGNDGSGSTKAGNFLAKWTNIA